MAVATGNTEITGTFKTSNGKEFTAKGEEVNYFSGKGVFEAVTTVQIGGAYNGKKQQQESYKDAWGDSATVVSIAPGEYFTLNVISEGSIESMAEIEVGKPVGSVV